MPGARRRAPRNHGRRGNGCDARPRIPGLSEEVPERKRVTPANLLVAVSVVAVIQLASLLITYQNLPVYAPIANSGNYSFNPLGSSPQGSAGNAALLVVLAFVLTLGLLWLLRRKMVKSFKLMIFGSVSMSAFILTLVTADTFAFRYLPPSFEAPASRWSPAPTPASR